MHHRHILASRLNRHEDIMAMAQVASLVDWPKLINKCVLFLSPLLLSLLILALLLLTQHLHVASAEGKLQSPAAISLLALCTASCKQ